MNLNLVIYAILLPCSHHDRGRISHSLVPVAMKVMAGNAAPHPK